jgi:hypothetical protein
MPPGDPAPELDSEALAAVITEFLGQFTDEQMEVAEEAGIKLNHLLFGFLEAEVLPQAMRAAEFGVDPTPSLPSSRECCVSTLTPWSGPTLLDCHPRALAGR